MERTIRVTGKGRVALKPDMTRINMTLDGIEKTYDAAIAESAHLTEIMNLVLCDIGFEKGSLKTKHFNIDTEYESYRDKKTEEWKRKFVGYKFVHHMKLEFAADNKMLGKVLYAIAHAPASPDFSIEYTVADPEKAKNQLLKNAIEDSKEKASVLSDAAGVTLGEITLIDYSWGEIEFLSRPIDSDMSDRMLMCCEAAEPSGSYDIDIEPDDINVSDTVTVVWQIG